MRVIKLVCLNATFHLGFFLFSLVYIPLATVVVAILSIFLSRRRTMRLFRRALSLYGLFIIHALPFPFIRVQYRNEGDERAPGPFLFVCNHRSLSDPFLTGRLPVEMIHIVNIWPFRLPVLGRYARYAGYLSVNEMDVEDFYKKAEKLLEQGVSIVSFPEGHRSASREMGPFHSSVFRLALRSRTPIVPVCISGNERIPVKGSLLLRPGIIRMHLLPPIPWEEFKDLDAFRLKMKVRDAIKARLAELEGEPEA